jgi:hypothetical protein
MAAMMVLFFWVLAAILLLAGIVLFGQNLIIDAAFGGAAMACVLIMDVMPAASPTTSHGHEGNDKSLKGTN